MSFKTFIRESGFKVLAMAHLGQTEYGVVLYLLNCAVSGLDQIITTEAELAMTVGYDEKSITAALSTLASRNIVRLHYSEVTALTEKPSVRLGLQYELKRWRVDCEKGLTSKDAVVFPFRRLGEANLIVLEGHQKEREARTNAGAPTWKRIFESYIQGRSLDEDELVRAEDEARTLVETHPVDQVLLMLRHFGVRIPSLSLLASSWGQYQEIFEQETQRVDMVDARAKHGDMDEKLRRKAQEMLERKDELKLNEEESLVLQILSSHRHPRRQLFWAYQVRGRYPGLSAFFNENHATMLPVTTSGTVVKRPPEDKDK